MGSQGPRAQVRSDLGEVGVGGGITKEKELGSSWCAHAGAVCVCVCSYVMMLTQSVSVNEACGGASACLNTLDAPPQRKVLWLVAPLLYYTASD